MKTRILISALLLNAIFLNAQTIMNIHRNNGTVITIPINTIDSITYTNGVNGIISNPGSGVTFNGYAYSSIILGNGQEWMAENLRTNKYANGDTIPNVTNNSQWAGLSSGAWAHYNNNNQYENPYGKLYNWYAVVDARNLCPSGWHIPSQSEWNILTNYLGGSNVAGGKLKITGTQYWDIPNTGATNDIGFSAVGGGLKYMSGIPTSINQYGNWWSSTSNSGTPWYIGLYNSSAYCGQANFPDPAYGMSVRCIKD